MAITFVGAGTGVTVTGTSGTLSKTGCSAGSLIIVQFVINGTGQSATFSVITNIEDIAGTDNAMTIPPGGPYDIGGVPQTGVQQIAYGRAMAGGTCSIDFTITSNDLVARMYEFSGVSTDTTVANIIDNTAAGTGMRQRVGNSTTPGTSDPAVTTSGTDRLAVAFVGITGNVATASMTGESGADWVEAVTGYADTPGTAQIQIASMPAAGSITGTGSQTIGSSQGWAVDCTAFVPAPVVSPSAADDPPIGFSGRGAGW